MPRLQCTAKPCGKTRLVAKPRKAAVKQLESSCQQSPGRTPETGAEVAVHCQALWKDPISGQATQSCSEAAGKQLSVPRLQCTAKPCGKTRLVAKPRKAAVKQLESSCQQSPGRREGCRAFGGARRQSRNRKKKHFAGARRQSRNRGCSAGKQLSAKPRAQGRVQGFWGGQAAVSEP